VKLRNGQTGKTATIRNVNFDPTHQNIFIQSATLNGKPYNKNWLQHDFFLNGDTLELTLGRNESNWGTAIGDLPPSLSPYENGKHSKEKRWMLDDSHLQGIDLNELYI
jgi:putative alpha-1,2-mannosidase